VDSFRLVERRRVTGRRDWRVAKPTARFEGEHQRFVTEINSDRHQTSSSHDHHDGRRGRRRRRRRDCQQQSRNCAGTTIEFLRNSSRKPAATAARATAATAIRSSSTISPTTESLIVQTHQRSSEAKETVRVLIDACWVFQMAHKLVACLVLTLHPLLLLLCKNTPQIRRIDAMGATSERRDRHPRLSQLLLLLCNPHRTHVCPDFLSRWSTARHCRSLLALLRVCHGMCVVNLMLLLVGGNVLVRRHERIPMLTKIFPLFLFSSPFQGSAHCRSGDMCDLFFDCRQQLWSGK